MLNRNRPGGPLMRRPQQGQMMRPGFSGLPFFGGSDPFREMEAMHRQMDDLFARFFGAGLPDFYGQQGQLAQSQQAFGAEPDVDIYENNNEFIIHAALPGINQDDIQIQATENTIYLTAESRSPFDSQNGQDTQGAAQQQSAQTANADNQQTTTLNAASNAQNMQSSQNAQNGQNAGQQNAQAQQPHTQHRQSRYSRQSRFQFAYSLPEEIKPDQVKANFRNGRLEIHLPKRQALANSQPVNVQVQGDSNTQNASLPSGTDSVQSGQPFTSSSSSPLSSQTSGMQSQVQSGSEGFGGAGSASGNFSSSNGLNSSSNDWQHQSRDEQNNALNSDIQGSSVASSETASAGAGALGSGQTSSNS